MLNILQNLMLGLTLAVPIGPVSVAVIKKGLMHGFIPSFIMGMGAVCADMTYLLAVYLGLSNIFTLAPVTTATWFFGSSLLLYMGYKSVRDYSDGVVFTAPPENKQGPFAHGYLLTLLNPMTVIWWLGVFGPILGLSLQSDIQLFTLLNSFAIIAGIILWYLFLSLVLHWGRRFINEKSMGYATLAAGLVLFGFGIIFAYNGVVSIIR